MPSRSEADSGSDLVNTVIIMHRGKYLQDERFQVSGFRCQSDYQQLGVGLATVPARDMHRQRGTFKAPVPQLIVFGRVPNVAAWCN